MTHIKSTVNKIDFVLLARQKAWLFAQCTPQADGILSLMDALQDAIVADGLATESQVFPTLS